MNDPTSVDYVLLEYILKHGPVHISQIRKDLSAKVDSLDCRLDALKQPKYKDIGNINVAIRDSSFVQEEYTKEVDSFVTKTIPLEIYSLTRFGKKVLQDFKVAEKRKLKHLWLKNAWIPILVSVIINLIIRGIEWLLPLALQLITNSP